MVRDLKSEIPQSRLRIWTGGDSPWGPDGAVDSTSLVIEWEGVPGSPGSYAAAGVAARADRPALDYLSSDRRPNSWSLAAAHSNVVALESGHLAARAARAFESDGWRADRLILLAGCEAITDWEAVTRVLGMIDIGRRFADLGHVSDERVWELWSHGPGVEEVEGDPLDVAALERVVRWCTEHASLWSPTLDPGDLELSGSAGEWQRAHDWIEHRRGTPAGPPGSAGVMRSGRLLAVRPQFLPTDDSLAARSNGYLSQRGVPPWGTWCQVRRLTPADGPYPSFELTAWCPAEFAEGVNSVIETPLPRQAYRWL